MMLSFLIISILFNMIFSFNFLALSFVLSLLLVGYLQNSSLFLNSSLVLSSEVNDELALLMVIMLVVVMFVSLFYSFELSITSKPFLYSNSILFMTLCCYLVFTTNNMFILYLFYEFSLIPILLIIIVWGSYPERSLSALMLLLYTAVFSLPFMLLLFTVFNNSSTLSISLLAYDSTLLQSSSFLISFMTLLTFGVKLPMYGVHFWLPMAHVEAPTFGSMILAGVLLKLGGVGLLRFSTFINFAFLKTSISSYLFLSLIFTALICCFQTDFKRLVAYSSVSHMAAIPLLCLAPSHLATKSLVMIMFYHGLCSPVMFMLVGILYSFNKTRQLPFMQGLIAYSPLLSFILVLVFFYTLPAPPFPSFMGEVFFMVSSYSISPVSIFILMTFAFISLIYNLNWLVAIVFSKSNVNVLSLASLSYKQAFPIFMVMIFTALSAMLFIFF